MKTIIICDKEYQIECNAFTYIKYNSVFRSGILKDMQFIQNYLIKQTVIIKKLEKEELSEAEKLSRLSNYMIDDTDEFIEKITKITWILIHTANNKVESYEDWLASIKDLNVNTADWIAEVTEFAVDCFC